MDRILIIEDDFLSQDLMRKIFQMDFEVDICESAEEYYTQYSQIKYSLIIMDIALKGSKTGIDLIREIRYASLLKTVPIICLTAHANISTKDEALKVGATLFFTKPVPNKLLKETAALLIGNNENSPKVN